MIERIQAIIAARRAERIAAHEMGEDVEPYPEIYPADMPITIWEPAELDRTIYNGSVNLEEDPRLKDD